MQYLYRNSTHPDAIQAMEDRFYELLAEDMLLNAQRLSRKGVESSDSKRIPSFLRKLI